MRRRLVSVLAASLSIAAGAAGIPGGAIDAQQARTQIVVRDSTGIRVPYAFVQLNGGVIKVADDSGNVAFNEAPRDSIRILARRMGYLPFHGWVHRLTGEPAYLATIGIAPTAVMPLQIEERRNTLLARTGFYDRLTRAQNSGVLARFISPEELDLRNPQKTSQMLQGEQTLRVRFVNQRAMLEGRGGRCGLAVMLDGHMLSDMLENLINLDQDPMLRRDLQGATSLNEQEQIKLQHSRTLTSVDELMQVASIAAIEIYPSPSAIPAELTRLSGPVSCGLVAIWSGSRR